MARACSCTDPQHGTFGCCSESCGGDLCSDCRKHERISVTEADVIEAFDATARLACGDPDGIDSGPFGASMFQRMKERTK